MLSGDLGQWRSTVQNNSGRLKPGLKRVTVEHWPYPGKMAVDMNPPGWHLSLSPSLDLKEVTLPRCWRELPLQGGE